MTVNKDSSKLFVEIVKKFLLILLIIIIAIFLLWCMGLVKTNRIIFSLFILILLIFYFNICFYLTKRLNEKINIFLIGEKEIISVFHVKLRGRKNFLKILPFLATILIFVYKILNPILLFLEIFIPKFYYHMKWINYFLYDYKKFREYYYRFVVYIIINPMIRALILYYYVKRKFMDQYWIVTLFKRIKGLLIWIILFSFWLTYLVEFFSIYWYILIWGIFYFSLIIFPWLPNRIKNNMPPIIEFMPSDISFMSIESVEKQIKEGHKNFKKESHLLNPKLIDFSKEINIFNIRMEVSCLGLIIKNLMVIISNDINPDFCGGNINISLNYNKLLKNYINIYIYLFIAEEDIMLNEINNGPSFVLYIMMYYFMFSMTVLNFQDIFTYNNLDLITKYSKILNEEKLYIEEYKVLKIKLLKFWLFYIWYLEDCLNVRYNDFSKIQFNLSTFKFTIVDMEKLVWLKNQFIKKEYESLIIKDFFVIEEGFTLFLKLSDQLWNLDYKLRNVENLVIVNYNTSIFSENPQLEEEKIILFYNEMNKLYDKIRKEYEDNKDKNIIELINSFNKTKN
jgi:hypothetical protein